MKDKVRRGGGRTQAKTDAVSPTGGNDTPVIKQDEDASFSVKIQGAGVEPFELQVHGFWLVQDAIMTLLSRSEVCPRSNLSVSLAGTTLDPLTELQSLKGLKAGTVVRLVEEPYTSRSARLHLARVLELLRASGPQDSLREGRSPSILETLTHTPDPNVPNGKSLKRSASNTKTESTNHDAAPPEYLLPGSTDRPLMALLPHSSQPESPSYLKDLCLSCWSPPPGHRKMQGDFMYITVVTLEGRRCDITSCPKGFFLNRSTEEVFDPRPAQSSPVCHCLSDLLCHISPAFKQTFTTLKNRPQQPPVEAMPTPYHTLSWLGPSCVSRTHKNTFTRLGVDEQTATQAPDWNEELQAARDLPQRSLEERLRRDRTMLEVNSAFVKAVMQGAEMVVDGFVEPVNGNSEDPAFLWGGLFMSQGVANPMFGGERGRRAAQRLELNSVQAYTDVEGLEGLHTLPTAIVDYRGVRLSAQGLAPGLESSEQDQEATPASRGLLYGMNAGLQESAQRRKLLGLLASAAKSLFLQKNVVVSPSGRKVPLFTSVDAQGLVGADGRLYVLDVFRTFPADANFTPVVQTENQDVDICPEGETESQEANIFRAGEKESQEVNICPEGETESQEVNICPEGETERKEVNICPEGETESQEVHISSEGETESQTVTGPEETEKSSENNEDKKHSVEEYWPKDYHSNHGLPKSFPHGLCRLRPELLQAFVQHKHCLYTQHVKETLDQNGGFSECAAAGDSRAAEAVRAGCREVGSLSDIIFEMRFNPNLFSPGVTFPPRESKSTNLQERLQREAAAFIVTHQIPDFVECNLRSNEAPMDGASLKQALHQRGINLRYLGHVIKAIAQSEHKENLRHIMRVTIAEVFIRSTRRVFNSFLQGVDVPSLSSAVSLFLNCLLVPHFTPSAVGEETKKKSRRRGGRGAGASESSAWSTLTGAELWNLVCQDAAETYEVSDNLGSGVNYLVEHYGVQKLSMLREFCLKTGVQLKLKDYFLDNQSKAPISPDDVLNIFPVVKHVHMPIVDATTAYRAAQISIQKGLLDQALERLKEAAYLFGRVSDNLHHEACFCHSMMAKVSYLQGKTTEARSIQLKAVIISERVLGFDHPNTIQQYAHLGVYMFAGGETALAQKCLLRARLLMLTVHGEDHPYIATLDSCLGLVLTDDHTGKFLKNALRLNTSFFGATHLHTGLSQHLLAQWMCTKGDYRSAMAHEKEALTAFTSLFGEDHAQTKCSKDFLSVITKQAVKVERTLRQAGAESPDPTVECLNPTSDTILEQMALATGIKKLIQSDKFQEYKQKHLERKAAARKELGIELMSRLIASEVMNGGEESSHQETECKKEAEDEGDHTEEKTSESKQEETVEETCVENDVMDSANGQVGKPEEQSQHDEPTDVVSDSATLNDEAKTESEALNDEAKTENTASDELKSEFVEENGEVNGESDVATSPLVPKSPKTWADVVSKPVLTNGTGVEAAVVDEVEEGVTANGIAEE